MTLEHWIVDAMNVIGSRPDGWWKDRRRAMRDFAEMADDHARSTGKRIIVVFDSDPGPLPAMKDIEIVIARGRGPNAADFEIQELVATDEDPSRLRVVTSDGALRDQVKTLGAKVISAGGFRAELEE